MTTLPVVGKVSTTEAEVFGRDTRHEEESGSQRRVSEFPEAVEEGCVVVPFQVTACIPESTIRKLAAHEPLAVHVYDCGVESLVCYFGD